MKKLLTLTMAILFMATMVCPQGAFAAPADPVTISSVTSASITASGTLLGSSVLDIDYLNGTALTFDSDGTDLVVTAPETIQITFEDNTLGFQSIIVSTNNTGYTGLNDTGAGLLGESDTSFAVPLHWAVFADETEATDYNDFEVFPEGTMVGDNDVSGYVDNTIHPYVVDRTQADFLTEGVIGYAAVLWDVDWHDANLSNSPYDDDPTTDNDSDPSTPSETDGYISDVDGTNNGVRTVDNGTAYMRLAVDYHNAKPQAYSTSTLTLDLVTIS